MLSRIANPMTNDPFERIPSRALNLYRLAPLRLCARMFLGPAADVLSIARSRWSLQTAKLDSLLVGAALLLLLVGCGENVVQTSSPAPPAAAEFCQMSLPEVEARIDALLPQMTLAEKVEQMQGVGAIADQWAVRHRRQCTAGHSRVPHGRRTTRHGILHRPCDRVPGRHRARRHLGPGTRRTRRRGDRRRGACQGRQRPAGAGHRRRAPSALGALARDLWRGPAAHRADGRRLHPRGAATRDRQRQALCAEQHREHPQGGQRRRRRADAARDLSAALPHGRAAGARGLGHGGIQPGERAALYRKRPFAAGYSQRRVGLPGLRGV